MHSIKEWKSIIDRINMELESSWHSLFLLITVANLSILASNPYSHFSRVTGESLMLPMVLLVSLVAPQAEFKTPAPEFNKVTEWVNSKPLKLSELRGKVVVVHFFAFG